GENQTRLRRAHTRLARPFQLVWRRLDLRLVPQSRFHRPRHSTRIRRPPFRSTRHVSKIEDKSIRCKKARRRKARPLRREVASLRRLVFHAEKLLRRRSHSRRFRRLSRLAKTKRHSPRDEKRGARSGDNL